jgi:hypothetical protein
MENGNDIPRHDPSDEPGDEDVERTGDLVELCRGGYCSLACLILYEHLEGKAEPWGLIGDFGIAHFFLMKDGQALDMGGYCSPEEMKRIFPGSVHEMKRVSLGYTRRMCEDAADPESSEIVEARIREYLQEHPFI